VFNWTRSRSETDGQTQLAVEESGHGLSMLTWTACLFSNPVSVGWPAIRERQCLLEPSYPRWFFFCKKKVPSFPMSRNFVVKSWKLYVWILDGSIFSSRAIENMNDWYSSPDFPPQTLLHVQSHTPFDGSHNDALHAYKSRFQTQRYRETRRF